MSPVLILGFRFPCCHLSPTLHSHVAPPFQRFTRGIAFCDESPIAVNCPCVVYNQVSQDRERGKVLVPGRSHERVCINARKINTHLQDTKRQPQSSEKTNPESSYQKKGSDYQGCGCPTPGECRQAKRHQDQAEQTGMYCQADVDLAVHVTQC